MAKKDDELLDENGNTDNNGQEDNSSEFRLATDKNGNETIEAVKPLDAAVVTADAPKRDNLTTVARTQEVQTINTTGSPTPEPTRKQERQARRAERRAARQTGETNEPPVEETQTGDVTKNPTGGVTENPTDAGAEKRKPEPKLKQVSTKIPKQEEQIIHIPGNETDDEDNTTETEETQDDSAGNPLKAGKEATVGTGADQAYANDPRVKGIQESNDIMKEAYTRKPNPDDPNDRGGILSSFDSLMDEFKKYDEERTRRDSENAFWRGIGEVGASLANLLGVSGAFGGKNAYGRGAYSAMQNFNLTTAGLTDKMKADMEKRKERMDALKQKQAELGLQWAQLKAKGAADLGNAKGAAADREYQRARDAEKDAREEARWNAEMELKQQIAADNAKRADEAQQEAARHNKEMEKINSTKTSGGDSYKDTPFKWEYVVPDGKDDDGKDKYKTKEIECTRETMEKALSSSYRKLADCLARMAGYDDYNDFANYPFPKRTNKYTEEDEQRKTADEKRRNDNGAIVRALDTYKNYTNDIESFDKMDSSMQNKFLEWAWDNWFKSDEFGDYVQRKVYNFDYSAQMRDYMNFLTGADNGGDDEQNPQTDADGNPITWQQKAR